MFIAVNNLKLYMRAHTPQDIKWGKNSFIRIFLFLSPHKIKENNNLNLIYSYNVFGAHFKRLFAGWPNLYAIRINRIYLDV